MEPEINPTPPEIPVIAAPAPPPAEQKHTTRRMTLMALFITAGLIGLYVYGQRPKTEQNAKLEAAVREMNNTPPLVIYTHPFMGPKHTAISLPGETAGFYEATICARVNGYLAEWKVDYGDQVKKDQLLAIVDTPELDEQLMQARAELEVSKADSALAKAKLVFAQVSFDRWESAAPSGAVSKEERDSKKADLDTGKAAYNASLARVDLSDANLKRLEFTKGFSRVTAPFDGIITNREVDIGSLITGSSTATTGNTPMFALSQQDKLRVFIKTPQTAMTDIKLGQEVQVEAREIPGRVFAGKVDRTAHAIETRTRTLLTEVLVDNPDLVLYPGMYVQVKFVLTHDPPHLLIPANALLLRATGPQVGVIGPDNRLHFRSVTIARDYGDKVELAEGLKGEERLGVNLNIQLREGDLVAPQQSQATASQPAAE